MILKWIAGVQYNEEPVECDDPECHGWYVDTVNAEGHCKCHGTEFFMSGDRMFICRLSDEMKELAT